MNSQDYKFESAKGVYSIHELEKIIVFNSAYIKGYTATINYPNDWVLTRVMQHIIELDKNHSSI